jgi:hypothetical protein
MPYRAGRLAGPAIGRQPKRMQPKETEGQTEPSRVDDDYPLRNRAAALAQ